MTGMGEQLLVDLLSRAESLEISAEYHDALQALESALAESTSAGLREYEAAALRQKAKLLRLTGELESLAAFPAKRLGSPRP